MSRTLAEAKRYLQKGWSVIPIRPKEKIPNIKWEGYSTSIASQAEIEHWFTNGDGNIGIVTGSVSNLVVVDCDSEEGKENARKYGLVSPVAVVTGKGIHYYFNYPAEGIRNSVKKIPGIDIRGEGGYVLAPPSVHPSGKIYGWTSPFAINITLPNLPDMSAFKRSLEGNRTTTEFEISNGDAKSTGAGWLDEAFRSLKEGNRNETFTRIVGKLWRDGYKQSDIFTLLGPHAASCLFPASELHTIIASISRYAPVVSKQHDGNGLSNYGRVGQGSYSQDQEGQTRPLSVRRFKADGDEYKIRRNSTDTGAITFPTGHASLDSVTRGFRRQEIFVVAARPGVGKSNWSIATSVRLAKAGKKILYFGTEMPFDAIWKRYSEFGGDISDTSQESFLVCDEFTPDTQRIAALVESVKPDIFIFDHINFVEEEPKAIAAFFKDLKKIAMEKNIPGIIVAQLNRQADWVDPKTKEKVIPRLSMIKGSGAIEEVAAMVLLMTETSDTSDERTLLCNLDKNRYGERGLVSYRLLKNPYQFKEV